MGGTPRSKDKPGPSYSEGRVRDASIEEKQEKDFRRADLAALIRRAAQADRGSDDS